MRVCVCVHVCPGELPGASRGLQNLQGSPGASRGLQGPRGRVCACVRESLQGPSGGSRSLQGPPRACVCVCLGEASRGLQGSATGFQRPLGASRDLQGPPGAVRRANLPQPGPSLGPAWAIIPNSQAIPNSQGPGGQVALQEHASTEVRVSLGRGAGIQEKQAFRVGGAKRSQSAPGQCVGVVPIRGAKV